MKAKRKPATKAKRKPSTKGTLARKHAAYEKLGKAYMAQESDLCDLLTMANIADEHHRWRPANIRDLAPPRHDR